MQRVHSNKYKTLIQKSLYVSLLLLFFLFSLLLFRHNHLTIFLIHNLLIQTFWILLSINSCLVFGNWILYVKDLCLLTFHKLDLDAWTLQQHGRLWLFNNSVVHKLNSPVLRIITFDLSCSSYRLRYMGCHHNLGISLIGWGGAHKQVHAYHEQCDDEKQQEPED